MQVLVSFHTQFSQTPPDAVWLVESPHNRAWFNLHHDEVDANSAIFRDWCNPMDIIWTVIDHHPTWEQIVVEGLPLTLDLRNRLLGMVRYLPQETASQSRR